MSICEFEHDYADLGEVTMHYVTAGAHFSDGPPIVLVHGWPQTWYEWRHVMPPLAAHHPVIALDMRGLGDSSRPLDGYDKRTVAGDLFRLLVEHLGLDRWHCVGHDWGGPVTFALGARSPQSMLTMTIIDVVIPGDGGDFSQGGRRWHHAFHMTPDLPEALVTGRERAYLGWFYREFSWRRDAIDASTVDEYLRTYTEPGALRAGFALYRNLPRDAADNAALLATGFRLPMPVLAMGGAKTEARGRSTEPEESMRRVAHDVTGIVIADSGHFVPEEQPEIVARHILEHVVARHG